MAKNRARRQKKRQKNFAPREKRHYQNKAKTERFLLALLVVCFGGREVLPSVAGKGEAETLIV